MCNIRGYTLKIGVLYAIGNLANRFGNFFLPSGLISFFHCTISFLLFIHNS